MPDIVIFCEDFAHQAFLEALVKRIAAERGIEVAIHPRSSMRGGLSKAVGELQKFVKEMRNGLQPIPDVLIVGIDSNCFGWARRLKEVDNILGEYGQFAVCAIPDPHIERWYLLDPDAFKKALGKSCSAPDQKCERDRYKRELLKAVSDAGLAPILGGIEHAQVIVESMNLDRTAPKDKGLEHLYKGLLHHFDKWKRPA